MTREEAIKKIKKSWDFLGNNEKEILETLIPELADSEDEKIKQRIIKLIKMSSEVGGFALHKWEADEMLAWLEKQAGKDELIQELGKYKVKYTQEILSQQLEKQGEQKTTNKVEPKFKVGDWITDGYCKCQITFIDSSYWYSETCVLGDVESINNTYHLWTIADAKPGDVLIGEDGYPFIYAGNHNYTKYLTAYCGITNDGEFKISDKTELWTNNNVEPATKEQRDLLFQKMKEAGYEWDAEKKELRKIEKQSESIKIKKGKNYLCTKTHKYAGVEWIKDTKYYASDNYTLVNQGCICYCPKYSKEEHNNFFKEVEYDGCLEKQGKQKEYTFKSLPRLLDMIEPTSKAKAYCQKLIDTLVKEGYFTDANIVGECLKMMNGDKVPMAIMDEKQASKPKWTEEDEENFRDIIGAIHAVAYQTSEDEEARIDWIKSIKQRMGE